VMGVVGLWGGGRGVGRRVRSDEDTECYEDTQPQLEVLDKKGLA
jgi:hypothetical protein